MEDIKSLLEEKYKQYNVPGFIESDPVTIPHRFSDPDDIAIAGFLSATIAWGKRSVILRNANILLGLMEDEPARFVREASIAETKHFLGFVHRTFSGSDARFFIERLSKIYRKGRTLEDLFGVLPGETDMGPSIDRARKEFLGNHSGNSSKHFASPGKGSAAKRINMFLRWMIRKDNAGVDFGIWKGHDPALLVCPLDIHSGNTARKLGLLARKQNDWKAAMELTENLRKLDPDDPVRFDFALFGLGVFEKF